MYILHTYVCKYVTVCKYVSFSVFFLAVLHAAVVFLKLYEQWVFS